MFTVTYPLFALLEKSLCYFGRTTAGGPISVTYCKVKKKKKKEKFI